MAARFLLSSRLPLTATSSMAAKRTPAFTRSLTSAELSAKVKDDYATLDVAAKAAGRPRSLEIGVPIMWAVCGGLILTAWNRIEDKSGQDNVERLLIV